MKPIFKENRGRPQTIAEPKKKGDVILLPIKNRQAAYKAAWRGGYKVRIWTDGKNVCVERLS